MRTVDEINTLSYRELQEECQKVNINAGGKSRILKRRLRIFLSQKMETSSSAADDDDGNDANNVNDDEDTSNNGGKIQSRKKLKKSPVDDLTCPITLELPYNPVTAEDGRVYERNAIEEWINKYKPIKSPVTNQRMGRRLFPAVQTKNLIETLIDNKVINGDLADSWKKKDKCRKDFQISINRAAEGHVDSMFKVGQLYRSGKHDVCKSNMKLAYKYLKKAADSRHVKAMALAGDALLQSNAGVEKNVSQGLVFITCAAERGSDYACRKLGMTYSRGLCGLPTDNHQATYWLKKALNMKQNTDSDNGECDGSHRRFEDSFCQYKHLSSKARTSAQDELQKIERGGWLSLESSSSSSSSSEEGSSENNFNGFLSASSEPEE